MNQHGFPPHLLTQPHQQRLEFFKNPSTTFMHGNLLTTYHRVHRAIHEPAGASVIMVIGPSGVGKSTLVRLLEKKIIEESLPRMESDPGWIPIVCVQAPAPGRGTFRWKSFYKTILLAVDEPGIGQKIAYDDSNIHYQSDGVLKIGSKATEDALRLAMEKALIYRHPYTLAVDEFQHIRKMAGREVLEAHMDCVKSAVNATKIPWTGFGTYQLIRFLELSPQLSRRTKPIHFPRYRLEEDKDIKEFKRVLEHLQYRMPLPETPALKQKYWEFCYERSIGNIGTLIDWLADAYDLALWENSSTVTLSHLQQTAKSASECEQMVLDAMAGESELTDSPEKSHNLRAILGLEKSRAQKPNTQANQNDKQQHPQTKHFIRHPKRDLVGESHYGES